MAINIYIVEDNVLLRSALKEFLNQRPDLRVCGATGEACEALAQLPQAGADLALIDVMLRGMNGIELVRELQSRQPLLLCLMFSSYYQPECVQQALAAGARGYITKDNPDEIFYAIQQVLSGKLYLSHRLRHAVSDFYSYRPEFGCPFDKLR